MSVCNMLKMQYENIIMMCLKTNTNFKAKVVVKHDNY